MPQTHLKISQAEARQFIFSALAVFLIAFLTIALWANWTLQRDGEQLLMEQQKSLVSVVAFQSNTEFNDRLGALELVAPTIDADWFGEPQKLESFLEKNLILKRLFNAGVFIVQRDGSAIAGTPRTGQAVLNYSDRDYVKAALQAGQPSVGKPVLSKTSKSPVIPMAVPIRDAQKQVIGVLVGLTDLNKPSFLDAITSSQYGKTGQFLLVSPEHRMIVTSSDQKRIMELLPAKGVNLVLDGLLDGEKSAAIFADLTGEEIISSTKKISTPGWLVFAYIPTKDAFAPIDAIQRQILQATAVMAVIAAALAWWLLGNQLKQLMSFYDPLTQLPNRKILTDRMRQVLFSIKRKGKSGAVMLLDLDNFKVLNDKQGHLSGDLLLVEVARRLTACVREVDTVARFGGDEFVVLLSELDADKERANAQARKVAEKISASLCAPYCLTLKRPGKANSLVTHQGSASIGVVVFHSHEAHQDELLGRADQAMYQAKRSGRNAVRFYASSKIEGAVGTAE